MTPNPRTAERNGRLWGARAQDWAEIQEGQQRALYDAILPRFAGQEMRNLDLGCGSGMAARIARDLGAKVSGLDAADSLLAIARTRVPSGDFRAGELEALPFESGGFDLVTGFNAFQYAGNPVLALREAGRVTAAHGQIVITTWGPPDAMPAAKVIGALRPLLPPPPPGTPGPFALSDENLLSAFARDAGLTPREIIDVKGVFQFPDLQTALRGLASSGVAARAIEHAGLEAVNQAHAEALAPFRQASGAYAMDAVFRCLIATP